MGIVFNVQRFSIHDGPGIRTTVFLKGCPLDCLWCHNPESKSPDSELLASPTLCIACGACVVACPEGVHSVGDGGHVMDRTRCVRCFACAEACPPAGLERAGLERSVEDVLEEVERDRPFYERSGGGMTLSGGEPLAQPAFALALLREAKRRGLHTVLDTCGFAERAALLEACELADLVLWDLKDTDPERHRANTGVPLAPILANLRDVDRAGTRTLLRCIVIEGVNATVEHMSGMAEVWRGLAHCEGVELLPYHELGRSKLERMGLPAGEPARDRVPSKERVAELAAILADAGVPVRAR